MSERLKRFRSIIQQSFNLGRTELKGTLSVCDQLLNPPPEPSEEDIIELAKGVLPDTTFGARIGPGGVVKAQTITKKAKHQWIMREVIDRWW